MPIDLTTDTGYAIRLLLSAVLGAAVGLEREIHGHPAGMRTHLLVSLGAAGFTVLSIAAFPAAGADPARVAAQIVTGVGFLGAGLIFRSPQGVVGLTTAAAAWAVAGMSVLMGTGALWVALVVGALILLILEMDRPFSGLMAIPSAALRNALPAL